MAVCGLFPPLFSPGKDSLRRCFPFLLSLNSLFFLRDHEHSIPLFSFCPILFDVSPPVDTPLPFLSSLRATSLLSLGPFPSFHPFFLGCDFSPILSPLERILRGAMCLSRRVLERKKFFPTFHLIRTLVGPPVDWRRHPSMQSPHTPGQISFPLQFVQLALAQFILLLFLRSRSGF